MKELRSSLELLCHVAATFSSEEISQQATNSTNEVTNHKKEEESLLNIPNNQKAKFEENGEVLLKNNISSTSSSTSSSSSSSSSEPNSTGLSLSLLEWPSVPPPTPASLHFETLFCFCFLKRFNILLNMYSITLEEFEANYCSANKDISKSSKTYRWIRQWIVSLLDLIAPETKRSGQGSWEKKLKRILPILVKGEHGSFIQSSRDYELRSFFELNLEEKLHLSKALCELALYSDPIRNHLKTVKQADWLRISPLGKDQRHQSYYAFEACPRLYRCTETNYQEAKKASVTWELLALTMDAWTPIIQACRLSKQKVECDLGVQLQRQQTSYLQWEQKQLELRLHQEEKEKEINQLPMSSSTLVASQFKENTKTQRILRHLGTTLLDHSVFEQLARTRLRSRVHPLVSSSSSSPSPSTLSSSSSSSSSSPSPSASLPTRKRLLVRSSKEKDESNSVPSMEQSKPSKRAHLHHSSSSDTTTDTTTTSSLAVPDWTSSVLPPSTSTATYPLPTSPSSYSRSPSPFLSFTDAHLPMSHPPASSTTYTLYPTISSSSSSSSSTPWMEPTITRHPSYAWTPSSNPPSTTTTTTTTTSSSSLSSPPIVLHPRIQITTPSLGAFMGI